MLDEIFGENCCVGQIAWQKRTSRENRAVLSPRFDHVLVYSKSLRDTWKLYRNLLPPITAGYSNPDNDPRGEWASIPFSAQGHRDNQVYTIITPTGVKLKPPKGRCWGATEPEFERFKSEDRVYWPQGGSGRPRIKQFKDEAKGLVPMTLWLAEEVGDTESSKKHLLEIFSEYDDKDMRIHAPKPVDLIRKIIEISTKHDSCILDSFAGTGTTAQAVLESNRTSKGNRRFILVEMEEYADRLSAERIRRVMKGYAFTGTQRTELLREKITWSRLKRADKLVQTVQELEDLHGDKYDAIKRNVKSGELILTGEKSVMERTEGLGGSFTYCTLGDPVELDKLLSGETLPPFEGIGAALFHMATNRALDPATVREDDCYLGEADGWHVWLIYRPDLEWLKSPDAALTLTRAREFAETAPEDRHLVFAPARYVSQKMLAEQNIPVEFVPLPFALYRIDPS